MEGVVEHQVGSGDVLEQRNSGREADPGHALIWSWIPTPVSGWKPGSLRAESGRRRDRRRTGIQRHLRTRETRLDKEMGVRSKSTLHVRLDDQLWLFDCFPFKAELLHY